MDRKDHPEARENRALLRSRGRRQSRRQASKSFFATPQSAVFCMLVALASVVIFWRGLPDWALLFLGVGALAVVAIAAAMWRSGRRTIKD